MVKALFITLNIAGLALLPFLYVGNVEVEHTAPSEIEAGGEIEVEITLNKGAITGPARLKLDFTDAEGITAEDIDNAGASFTFTGDNSLYIWYSIQPDEVIKLKYKIKAADGISGTKTISGSFSYLDESERKKINIPSIIIEVTGGAVAENSSETGGTSEEETETEPEEISIGGGSSESTGSAIDNITCSRSVEQDGDDFIVTIDIDKGSGNGGFARVKEVIPAGFTATEIDSEGAVFKNVDNYVKFLWTSLPRDKESVTLKYRLIPETATDGDYQVNGEFSGEFLIVDDVPQKVKIPTSYLTVSGQPLATNDGGNGSESGSGSSDTGSGSGSESGGSGSDTGSGSEDGNDSGSETDGGSTASAGGGSSSDETDGGSSQETDGGGETASSDGGSGTSVNTPNTSGVRYKVQVLAAHKTVSSRYIKKRYGYTGKIALENHEGWVKYTTGKYNVYKDARDKRETLGSYDFPGPFVTAYNSGDRITVQEALMITKQDWVQ